MAGANTSTGSIGIGTSALLADTSGVNVAIGYQAGEYISTGTSNTAVGYQAMTGVVGTPLTSATADNTAFGYQALNAIQGAATLDTAVGAGAMAALTTGNENTAVGFQAAQYVTTGIFNTALGTHAMQGLVGAPLTSATGENTAVGDSALLVLQGAATQNTAVGYQAGDSITTGTGNTLLGYTAGSSVTGNSNVIVGIGGNITSGGSNSRIGNSVAQTTAGSSNQIDIGDNIMVYADTHLAIHSTAFTTAKTTACPTGGNAATSISGNDNTFTVTQSANAASTTLCTINFETTWVSTPVCVASWGNAAAPPASILSATASTTAVTIYASTAENSETINVTCLGYK